MNYRAVFVRKDSMGAYINIPQYGPREFGPCDTDPSLLASLLPGDGVIVTDIEDIDEDYVVLTRIDGEPNSQQRLNDHAAPDGPVNFNNQRAVQVADPVQPQDAINLRTLQAAQQDTLESANEYTDERFSDIGTAVQPYERQFVIPAQDWPVPHNFNRDTVDMTLTDLEGNTIVGQIQRINSNTHNVHFDLPVSGIVVVRP